MTTRVLVVDDSTVIRRLLTEILQSDPEIEVVGSAPDAETALERLVQLKPDVMTLDVEMPGTDGLELLVEVRKRAPRLPVIMFSSLTERAAVATLEALARGATDYVTKPAGTGSREASAALVREQLVPKIKALGVRRVKPITRNARAKSTAPTAGVEAVVIGASTGGPNALTALLSRLPKPITVPIAIVQHMPPVFTQMLADRLRAATGVPCAEAKHGQPLVPGEIIVAPGDFHLRLVRKTGGVIAELDRGPPENSCRPAVDALFRSAADAYGAALLAVILTGMGQDGLLGCEHVRKSGGRIVVQDEATSVVWGMPGFVARAGLADAELPPAELAALIGERLAASKGERRHVG